MSSRRTQAAVRRSLQRIKPASFPQRYRALPPDMLSPIQYPAWQYISTARLARDTLRLTAHIPPEAVGIVGIPRSGMLPAGIISQLLHLPLYEISPQQGLRRIGHGSRGSSFDTMRKTEGPLVVIDDTIYGGGALSRAKEQLAGVPAIYGAVYVRPEVRQLPDFYAAELPSPHLLEWNLFNNGPFAGYSADPCMRGGVAVDFDGILCHDPPMPDSQRLAYESWLPQAPPLYTPRLHPIPLIVTFRLEKYRALTEAWLRRQGIRWQRLIMHSATSPEERDFIPQYKGDAYRASGCSLFIESDPRQAHEIADYTGLPVLCPQSETVYGSTSRS